MGYRRLGKSSLAVSAMGLGCMGMSQSYGPADESESIATLYHAMDEGIDLKCIEEIAPRSAFAGQRYNAEQMKRVGV